MLETLNRYCHGLVSIPLIHTLRENGSLAHILSSEPFTSEGVARELSINRGYLEVALRVLVCLGWLRQEPDGRYTPAPGLGNAEAIPGQIMELYEFPFGSYLRGEGERSLEPWLGRSEVRWGCDRELLADLLDGVLIVPLLLALDQQGRWAAVPGNERSGGASTLLHLDLEPAVRAEVERLVLARDWAAPASGKLMLSPVGRFILERIRSTAVVASYRPMLLRAEELLFGDAAGVFARDPEGHETHVDRTLNVLGSGFQHTKYFTALSELIVGLFDNDAYEFQPRYVADTGCGDGSLLRRVYETVRDRTSRGKVLDRYPLIPIAVDLNDKALAEAAATLEGIEHLVLKGDVGDPERLLRDLAARGVEDPGTILHIRSFLDHDRPFREPKDAEAARTRTGMHSSGVFIDAGGDSIPPEEVVQSTVEHLRRWSRVVNDHGLIVLEVHCLPTRATARFLDESESLHFDAAQSMSHQLLLEPEIFLVCAAEAGLFCRPGAGASFPRNLPFTRITLNHFKPRPYAVRHARHEDLSELLALEEVWPQPGLPRDREGMLEQIQASLGEFARGQFVLEEEGRIVAAAYCAREEHGPSLDRAPVRVVAVDVRSDDHRGRALELLELVERYSQLDSECSMLWGVESCRKALGRTAEPSWVEAVARDVAGSLFDRPFDPEQDPRVAERDLGDFAFRWGLAVLQKMGVLREPGETYTLEELERSLGVVPKYHRYFEALVRKLADRHVVTLEDGTVRTTERLEGFALGSVDQEVADFAEGFRRRHPECAGSLDFVVRCLSRYEEILAGRVDVADVVFHGGDPGIFTEVFRGDPASDYFNRTIAEAARAAVDRWPGAGEPGAPKVRILEVGAGTGATTEAVLEALDPLSDRVELCFTDLSGFFVRSARRRFADRYPWVDFRTFDVEADPSAQGIAPHGFHLVLAANVLHDTRDVDQTLRQTGRLLVPGGLLVISEFTDPKDFLTFSGKLLHGAWLFEDPERRLPDNCLLSVSQWGAALGRAGFSVAGMFPLPTQRLGGECSQTVLLCEAPRTEVPADRDRPKPTATAVRPAAAEPARGPAPGRAGGSWRSEVLGRCVEEDLLTILGDERAAAYDAHRPLMAMGLDSIELVELRYLVGRRFDVELSSSFLFEHETPSKIARALEGRVPEERLREAARREPGVAESAPAAEVAPHRRAESRPGADVPVAIVGLACRLPGGVTSPETFWELLEEGRDGIVGLPPFRWKWPDFVDVDSGQEGIDRGGFLERIDEFDARFFRVSPREAELMDPQQRLLLELSWKALEDAGHRPSELAGSPVGVFVGACHDEYRDLLSADSDLADAYVGSGSASSILANRLSYVYDLKGPSLTVDTACSSSLFALHDAVHAIARGECDEALVGAANLLCSPTNSIAYYQAGMLSRSGKCRTFDESADGYVRGEGGVMLFLRPLDRALEDGDSIYGVVRGSAVNHGGQAASLTAPKPDAQAAVIETAWARSGATPDSIGYIEAHGTGTPLGDPVEVAGLARMFERLYRKRGMSLPAKRRCGIGSVKSNLGHLEGAAGLAGLVKVLLAMEHGVLPRTLHVERLNPELELDGTPLYVVERNVPWPSFRDEGGKELPRRAGVSSFGFGGANAHVVVEQHRVERVEAASSRGPFLVPLSAKTEDRLADLVRGLLEFLERFDDLPAAAASGGARDGSARDRLEEELRLILRRRFDLDDEDLADPEWEELGWSAAEMGLFLAAVEERLGVKLHSRALVQCPSLPELAGWIARERGDSLPEPSPIASPGHDPIRTGPTLAELAYTLQVGREAMDERVLFVVEDGRELLSSLRRYLAGETHFPGCHRGTATAAEAGERPVDAGADDPSALAAWTRGAAVDWTRLYPSGRPRRVHLPTYSFARDRFWFVGSPRDQASTTAHPFLDGGRTEVLGVRCSTSLTGDEAFLTDHVIQGRRILPAVAQLEMVRAAVERTGTMVSGSGDGRAGVWLQSVAWLQPFYGDRGPARLHVRLTDPEDGDGLSFDVYSHPDGAPGEELLHGQGRTGTCAVDEAPPFEVGAVRSRCTRAHLAAETCYTTFAGSGYDYGPAHRALEELFVGDDEILAKLRLPGSQSVGQDGWVLHPSLADAAFQATLAFAVADPAEGGGEPELLAPFELRDVRLLRPCVPEMWAWVRRITGAGEAGGTRTFDVDLLDGAGHLCARFTGLVMRRLKAAGNGAGRVDRATRPAATSPGRSASSADLLLVPEWEPVSIPRREAPTSSAGSRTAIVGGTEEQRAELLVLYPNAAPLAVGPDHDVDRMRRQIASWGEIEHLVWIVPSDGPAAIDDESRIEAQRNGTIFLFRLVRALLAEGYDSRALLWSVLTIGAEAVAGDAGDAVHASIHGLVGTLAKEYGGWGVRLIDLPASGDWPWDDLPALPPDPDGTARVYRDGVWHRRRLVPCPSGPDPESPYRADAVYVVIGGAGGIGVAWSEAVLRRVRARLVWIGRRPEDEDIRADLDRLAEIGPRPLYVRADASDREQMAAARATIEGELGRVDGIVHTAMALRDKTIATMEEEDLRAALEPKVDACVRLVQVFGDEPLDFIVFFSSVNAFTRWPGQSNYAAGCAFVDAFARRLEAERPYPVRVMNWGYWGSVGAAASEGYRALMARKGLGSIEIPEAMEALDRLLSGPHPQLAYLAVTDPAAIRGVELEVPAGSAARRARAPGAPGPATGSAPRGVPDAAEMMGQPKERAVEELSAFLRRRVAEAVGVAEASLDSPSRPFGEALLGEFGMDSLSSNGLRNVLRQELGVDIPVNQIISEPVHEIVEALYEKLLLRSVGDVDRGVDEENTETFVF